jgi:membrane-associated phospholipid phosphatase
VDNKLGVPMYRAIYDYIGVNQFAAFPSLHSAFPWIIALFAIKAWKKKALPILIFPIMVWFSAVYLGEHYVIDIIGGVVYATLAFIVACNKDRIKDVSIFNVEVITPILDRLGEGTLPAYPRSQPIYAMAIQRIVY